MRRLLALLAILILCHAALAAGPKRPRITGISHVAFYSSNLDAANKFYSGLLGLAPGPWAGAYVVGEQRIDLEKDPATPPHDRIAHVAFATDDAEAMRAFLAAHAIDVPADVHREKDGTRWFALKDPEGHPIEFVQEKSAPAKNPRAISQRLIHAGFVVRDRALEDKFYGDLLGFRVYWHGGMTDDRTEWVDMQVPDGTQWLEYMLIGNANPDARLLGIVNHVALGVPSIKAAAEELRARGWKDSPQEHPQLGRDGKWQLNLYDPDGTRVELMEFTPVEKPCCSDYTGPHPH